MSTATHPRSLTFRAVAVAALALSLAAAGSAASGKRVIAKLGQTLRDVGIHSRMSASARVFYQTKQYEYLAVNPTKSEKWLSVVLQNGGKGYVPSDAVAVLPYNVLRETPKVDVRGFYPKPHPSDLASNNDAFLPQSNAGSAANYALNFVGTPYKWGGTDLGTGIDCSGFVQKMFGTIGVNLPRTAAEQVNVGQPITRLQDLQKGDRLYFWEAKRGKIGHTGIFLGYVQNKPYFVHSSSGKGGVATSMLTSSWVKILVAARRS
jgi:cell wall-associated NlpC family hydrolase